MTTNPLRKFKNYMLILVITIIGSKSEAQTTVQVGSGILDTKYFPIYTCFWYNYSQQVYLASELMTGGATGPSYINKIRFKTTTITVTKKWNDWQVYLGNTAASGFFANTSWKSGLTQVYNGKFTSTTTTAANTWYDLILSTPFYWDGVSNLVVGVYENTPDYYCNQLWASFDAIPIGGGTRGLLYFSDSTNPNPNAPPTANYANNTIAQIQFEMASVIPNGITAIVTIGSFTVEAYPNPISQVLTVKVSKTKGNGSVTMTDLMGKIIREVNLDNDQVQINMEGLTQGMYLLKYADDQHTEVIKVYKK